MNGKKRKLNFAFKTICESLAAIVFMFAMLLGSNFFIIPKLQAEDDSKYVLKVMEYAIEGDYGIMSAYDNNLYFDISGGMKLEDKVPIIAYQKHYKESNQKFTFYATPSKIGYMYYISPTYTSQYMLDINECSADDGTPLQIYSQNDSNAQQFTIKEVYERIGSEEKYIGYMILTATSNFKKALTIDQNNNIVQKSVDLNNIDLKQVWFLDKGFSGYCYSTSGYRDVDKVQGKYNAINYDLGNDMGGFYLNLDYWSKFEDFLSIRQTSTWKPQTARMTQYGYTLFDSANLNVTINNTLSEVYEQILGWKRSIGIGYDESTMVNNKYVEGTVGYGCVEVEYTDSSNKTFSIFTNNVFANTSNGLRFNTKNGNYTFDQAGSYTIRVYYKVKADYITYVMKEFQFSIGTTTTRCDALMATEDEGTEYQNKDKNRVLSSYTFSVNNNNKIQIAFDGNEEYRANDEELINYLTNSYYLNDEEKQESINKFIEEIKKYNEYKVYFTNTAFFMSSGSNSFAQIKIIETGFDKATSTICFKRTKSFVTDGIYEFVSSNQYAFGVKNYYRVLLQSEPNKQVFRNVTYCYSDEQGKLINYAIDYAFLEDLKIFPYTMTLSITYENITNDSINYEPINYKSNSIVYNTTDELLKLKFVIKDISGNKTTLYLNIFPTLPPTLNLKNLQNSSYDYNYNSNGYSIKLYDQKRKAYSDYLFSSKEIALQNFLTNIIESQDICERQDNGYELRYDPNGNWSSSLQFESNEQLIEYLYELFENNVNKVALTYDEAKNCQIPEKAMHFDTLYLDKDFYFTTDKNFPLFESYKVYFSYYNNNGKLLKDGLITYNGEFKYGESMFHILASDNEENWCDGYVDFVEYNISSNEGNQYTAYIVNANSNIVLSVRQGTKYEKNQYNNTADISCEDFSITYAPGEGVTYIVEYENERIIANHYTFKTIKFNKAGTYRVVVENTHGFKYELNIKVYSLEAFIEGAENFGIVENDVKFRADDLDFKHYINGKLQKNDKYDLVDGKYVFTFKATDEDINLYIVKNFMQFACLIKGEQEFDVSPFYANEEIYASPADIREYRRDIKNNLDTIKDHIINVNNLINDFEPTPEFSHLDIQNAKYDYFHKVRNDNLSNLQKEQSYLDKLLNSKNVMLKQNKNYEDVYVLQNLLGEYQRKIDDYNESLKRYACRYFEKKGISLPVGRISEIVSLNEKQIIDMYSEYLKLSEKLDKKELLVLDINKQLNELVNVNNTYIKEVNFVVKNYNKADRLEKLLTLSDEFVNCEKTHNSNILKLKRSLEKISFDGLMNVFMQDNIERISAQKQAGLTLVSEAAKVDFSNAEMVLKQQIIDVTKQINQEIVDHIQKTDSSLTEKIEERNKLQNEKEWWKIFSNIKRNKKIEAKQSDIQNLYKEHMQFVEINENNLEEVKHSLENAVTKNPTIIENDLIFIIDKTLTDLKNLTGKITREAV